MSTADFSCQVCYFCAPHNDFNITFKLLEDTLEDIVYKTSVIYSSLMHRMNLHLADWRLISRECIYVADIFLSVWCQSISIHHRNPCAQKQLGMFPIRSHSQKCAQNNLHSCGGRLQWQPCEQVTDHLWKWKWYVNSRNIGVVRTSVIHLPRARKGRFGYTCVYTITFGYVLCLCSFHYIIQTFWAICSG